MIELGKKAKDKVTGFSGIITARAQYLTGCDQYCLQPKAKKGDDKGRWFDEGRLTVTGDGVTASEVASDAPGGPRETPSKS